MQADKIAELNNYPGQAKQMNELLQIINKSILKEFPTFLKLVQYDTMTEVQKKAVADGKVDKAAKQLTDGMDAILNQVGKDLEKQIKAKMAELQSKTK